MPRTGYWDAGNWNAVCDQCGRRFKATRLYQEWDKLRVCETCLDPRHPQELKRPMVDPKPVPWSRPQAPLQFVNPNPNAFERVVDGFVIDGDTLG